MADISIDLGNIRGLKGDPGDSGQDGQDGARGSLWYTGTALTHTSGSAATETGIDGALTGDMYLNTETSDVYRCTAGGDSGEAVWAYLRNIRGANGNGSLVASTASDGYTDVTFTDALSEETTFRAGNTRPTLSLALTLAAGLTPQGASVYSNRCIARGDVVFIDLYIEGFSLSVPNIFRRADTYLAALPEGCRPNAVHRVPGLVTVSGSGAHLAMFDIQDNGNIESRWIDTSSGTAVGLLLSASVMRA